MKLRSGLILGFFLGLSITTYAQFSVGALGGINFSNAKGKDVADSKGKITPNLGFWCRYDLAENFGAQMGFLFSQTKAEDLEIEDDYYGKLTLDEYKVSYLHVPVYGTYSVPINDFKLNFLGGLYAGLKIGSDVSYDLGKDVNLFDFGLSGGVDFQVTPEISVQGVYTHGILQTIPSVDALVGGGGGTITFGEGGYKVYNRLWQFRMVYYFFKG